MQTPFKARDPIVSKHKLRLLIDPDVVDANLVACLACESVVIEGVKLNAFDLLVVDEPSVYPGLSSVTDLYRISDCCKQLSLRARQPAHAVDVCVHIFKLELGVENSLRIRVRDKLANNLLVNQIEVIFRLGTRSEGGVEIPHEQTALLVFASAPLVACRHEIVSNTIPRDCVASASRDLDVLVDKFALNPIR